MKILFVIFHLPNMDESSSLYGDLIQKYSEKGHEVTVLAPLFKGSNSVSKEKGVNVIRVRTMQLYGVGNIKKGIAYQATIITYLFSVVKYLKKSKFDLIISHTPPPEMSIIIDIIKRKFKAPFYLLLRDYTWQDAVGLKMFTEKNPICYYYKYLEKKAYNLADWIGCLSKGNIEFILKYYPELDRKKIHVVPNFQTPIKTIDIDYSVKEKYGLEGKFVAVHGGNFGIAQKVENIVALAEKCQKYDDVIFLFIGKGTEFGKIKQLVEKNNIKNIVFYDFIPRDEYMKLIQLCDIGIISLNEKTTIPNFPSKTLSYLNLSIPILASIDYVTDYGDFLDNVKCGLWSYGGEIDALMDNFEKLYNSKSLRQNMGENGYNYFMKDMTTESVYNVINNFIAYND